MTKSTDNPIAGYNVTLTFNVGDLPFITDDEAETKQYLYKKLMYMVAYEMYMLELHIRQGGEADCQYTKCNKEMIRLINETVNNHTFIKTGEKYILTLPFIDKEYEGDAKFTREQNDGIMRQFIYDMLRQIGMCYYVQLTIDVADNISIIENTPVTPEEWAERKKHKPESEYWLSKAGGFKMETIYK